MKGESTTITGFGENLFEKAIGMRLRYHVGLLGIIVLAALPLGVDVLMLTSVMPVFYLMIFAMSWDIVSGYTGQISLGHSFFFALGGYGSAVLNTQHGVSPLLSIPLAVLLAVIGGFAIGIPALRIRGRYLALVTLIIPVITMQIFILFNSELPYIAPDGLGGTAGLIATPTPFFGTSDRALITVADFSTSIMADYYLSFALFVVLLAILLFITRIGPGHVLTAIREDENAVATAGLNPVKFKVAAFVISAAVGGLAGAVFVHTAVGFPVPSALLDVSISLNVIIMTVLGGVGTIVGAAIGALLFHVLVKVMALDAIQYTIPVLNRTPEELLPLPVLLLAMVVLYVERGGVVRWAIRAAQRFLPEDRV